MSDERVSYADAGRTMRATLERVRDVRTSLRSHDRAVLDAVFALTVSYSRIEDRVFAKQVAEIAGVDVAQARKSLKKLADKNVIGWQPVRGSHRPTLLSLKGSLPTFESKDRCEPVRQDDSVLSSKDRCEPATEKSYEKSHEKIDLAEAITA